MRDGGDDEQQQQLHVRHVENPMEVGEDSVLDPEPVAIDMADDADHLTFRVVPGGSQKGKDILIVSDKWVYMYTYTAIHTCFNNKIAIQGEPQMAVDKEAIRLSRVYSYYSKCNMPLFYV